MEEQYLKELYEAHCDSIYYYLKGRCGSEELAFDLMQETFIKASLYYKNVEYVKAWLFTIARNLLIDHMKKSSSRNEVDQDTDEYFKNVSSSEEMEKSVDWKILKESMLKTLAKENPVFPELFLLRLNHDLTHKEIAEITRISFRTIRRHFEKIRNVIYQYYKDDLNIAPLYGYGKSNE